MKTKLREDRFERTNPTVIHKYVAFAFGSPYALLFSPLSHKDIAVSKYYAKYHQQSQHPAETMHSW